MKPVFTLGVPFAPDQVLRFALDLVQIMDFRVLKVTKGRWTSVQGWSVRESGLRGDTSVLSVHVPVLRTTGPPGTYGRARVGTSSVTGPGVGRHSLPRLLTPVSRPTVRGVGGVEVTARVPGGTKGRSLCSTFGRGMTFPVGLSPSRSESNGGEGTCRRVSSGRDDDDVGRGWTRGSGIKVSG